MRVPLWQCPRLLFIIMGAAIILAMVGTYFFLEVRTEPEMAALIVVAVAGVLLVQSYIIILATEHIAETSRLKTEFINITSHQLRSPLTASRWAAELMRESSSGLPDELKENLKIIEDSNERMNKLVYALLQVARIEANTVRQHKRDVDVVETIKTVIDEATIFAKASNISLDFNALKEQLAVNFDPDQLHFIVQEMVDNAIRYSNGKGNIQISLTKNGNQTHFEIKDSGVGIPKDEQKNIFQKFYRGSNTYTLSPSGTGLSLFIVKKIIEAGGGRIGFSSKLNEGSTFWFNIPLALNNQNNHSN